MAPLFQKDQPDDWFLPKDVRTQLAETFKNLDGDVVLETFTQTGVNDEFADYTLKFCADLARLSDRISTRNFAIPSDRAKKLGVTAAPTLCLNPDDCHIRFLGAPVGEEGKSLITAILLLSLGKSALSELSVQLLDGLKEERLAQVFVSPT
ncbi:hypothetical protein [Pseudodesulfovibrio portus]|uniref:Uncharacterized protein n=1 Tax=Pseudodesulfovibrio portus TaxID=231439 RepID=A0ABM8AQC9_9BACT|nr:hypothetical protein [Pseudodesulfovibrio portus]BDQ33621.1 hypothetical protein JCM14722_11630 [Pseudodesulfovibrio portus]